MNTDTQQYDVFVSHTHADIALCEPLQQALDRWGVRYWFDTSSAVIGNALLSEVLSAMQRSQHLLRICTSNTNASSWMQRELGMFLAFETARLDQGQPQGKIITVRFDGYSPDAIDQTRLFVDAAEKPTAAWIDDVRRALGRDMGAVVFDGSDADYLWWICKYSRGYVISVKRGANSGSLMLHRANCGYVSSPTGRDPGDWKFTEGGVFKVAALTGEELQLWAQQRNASRAQLVLTCTCLAT
jgi:hypothetical protein